MLSDRDQRPSEAGERAPAQRAPVQRAAGPPSASALTAVNILALQVSAGNAAVSRMLMRDEEPGGVSMHTGPQTLPWPTKKGPPTNYVMREDAVSPAWLREQGYLRVKGHGDMWRHPKTGDQVILLPKKTRKPGPPATTPAPKPPEPLKEPRGAWEPHEEDSALVEEVRGEAARMVVDLEKLGTLTAELSIMRLNGKGHSPEYEAKLTEAETVLKKIDGDVDAFNRQLPSWREEARLSDEEDVKQVEGLAEFVSGGKRVTANWGPMIEDFRKNREPPKPEDPPAPEPGPNGGGGGGGGGPAPDPGQGGGGGQPE